MVIYLVEVREDFYLHVNHVNNHDPHQVNIPRSGYPRQLPSRRVPLHLMRSPRPAKHGHGSPWAPAPKPPGPSPGPQAPSPWGRGTVGRESKVGLGCRCRRPGAGAQAQVAGPEPGAGRGGCRGREPRSGGEIPGSKKMAIPEASLHSTVRSRLFANRSLRRCLPSPKTSNITNLPYQTIWSRPGPAQGPGPGGPRGPRAPCPWASWGP